MSEQAQLIRRELWTLGQFYGLDSNFHALVERLDLSAYVEIVLGEAGLEVVIGGLGKERALIEFARAEGFPAQIVEAFARFAERFPERMLYTKLCFGPGASAPSMYFVAMEPWPNILAFLGSLPALRPGLAQLGAAVEGSSLCFLLGFTLEPQTRALLVKTYHLFDRQQGAPEAGEPKPFLISHRIADGRVLGGRKRYTVTSSWESFIRSPRWTEIVECARSLFGDAYTLMRGEPDDSSGEGAKLYLFRYDRRESEVEGFALRSYNYYVDEGGRLLQVQDEEAALRSFANAVDYAPEDGQTASQIASYCVAAGRYLEGVDYAERAQTLERGQRRCQGTARHGLELERLNRALEAQQSVGELLARGSLCFALEELEPALADFCAAAQLDPGCAAAHNAIGGVCLRLGQYARALEACTRARALSPEIHGSNLQIATRMAQVNEQLEASESAALYTDRGLLHYHLRDYEKARADFLRAQQGAALEAAREPEPRAVLPRSPRPESEARKFLFIPMSSYGYVFSAIKLAHLLQSRGQEVLFATASDYGALLEVYGVPCVRVRNQVSGSPFLSPGSWFLSETVATDVDALEAVIASYEPDVIVTTPLTLSAFILAERHSLPVAVIGFSEYLFPTAEGEDPEKTWRVREMARHYNGCRARLGLGPVPVSSEDFALLGDLYLIRSVPEMDERLALPPGVHYAGGLYWEPHTVDKALEAFIGRHRAAGLRLAYVQVGRLFNDHAVWTMLTQALGHLDMAFVVDTGRADYLRGTLDERFYVQSFIPLGSIADDIDLVINSGQSTTVISSILHEKPMLCIPHSSDSRAVGAKVAARGLGLTLDEPTQAAILEAIDTLQRQPKTEALGRYRQLFMAQEDPDSLYARLRALSP